jgi:hypothetical protein
MESKINMLEYALRYKNEFGFSVIPVKGKSGHLVQWSEYQHEKPSEDQIKEWWNKWPDSNIGIITGAISGITVIDIDSYKLSDEDFEAVNKAFPDDFATATALSGSGGQHRYFAYDPDVPTRNDIMKGVDIKNDGGVIIAPPSKNENGTYQWLKSKKISVVPPRAFPDFYKESINNSINSLSLYIGAQESNSHELTNLTKTNIYYKPGRRDDDLFHAANCLIKGGSDPQFARQTLELIANNLGKEFTPKVVNDKINSVLKRVGRQDINIADEFRTWVELTEGNFNLTQCSHELTLTNKNQKQALYMACKRLCDEGIIEKYGDKRGVYRRVEQTVYEDWINADYDAIKLNLPFGLGQYVDIFPGDLIVIAGVKNAGKTAFALNFIKLNMNEWDSYYHSSELVKQTFKLRVSKDEDNNLQDWSKVKMTQGLNMSNAKDRVVKDALNVFDYIEGDDGEFYKIPAAMARIHRALGDGIGVVCLQKPSTRDFARGGEGTKDKAALYLTIDKEYPYHVCRVNECKTFKEKVGNPTGYIIRYKVKDGINLYSEGVLMPEIDKKYQGLVK